MSMDSGFQEIASVGLIVVLSAVSLIPIGFVVKAWLVDDVLEMPLACGALMAILTLSGAAWASRDGGLAVAFMALLLVLCVAIPLWATRQDKIHLKEIRDDDMEKYRRALQRDPNNASAYVFIGDALMERRSFVAAIAQYEMALMLAPHNDGWKRKLRNAQELAQDKNNLQKVTT